MRAESARGKGKALTGSPRDQLFQESISLDSQLVAIVTTEASEAER